MSFIIWKQKEEYRKSVLIAQQQAELQRIKMMNEIYSFKNEKSQKSSDPSKEEDDQFNKGSSKGRRKSEGEISFEINEMEENKNVQIQVMQEFQGFEEKKEVLQKEEIIGQSIVSNRQIIEQLPKMEGWLSKRSPVFVMGWQRRYCQIENRKFYYFLTAEKLNHLGCIDFNLVPVEIEDLVALKQFRIKLKGTNKVFLFRNANQQEDVKHWIDMLRLHVIESQGLKTPIKDIYTQPRFWRSDRISKSYFEKSADTCDILLFRGKALGCRLQRSFTRSEYDHVALLLRYSNADLYIFESTGNDVYYILLYNDNKGVGLLKWETFIKKNFHLLYEKLVFRHLDVERSDHLISELEKFSKAGSGICFYKNHFLQFALGKRFVITASKLLRKTANDEELHNDTTFFCSELVAAAYKRMGLLTKNISAAQYWPGAFAAQRNLRLEMNAKLCSEFLIDFSIPD